MEKAVDEPKVFKVSVIIVAYDRDIELNRLLDSIYTQSMPIKHIEILVVDNKGLCNKTKEVYSQKVTTWITTKENIGASAGRNLAAKNATTPYLIFLDDDGVPETDFLQIMFAAFEKNSDFIAARGKIKFLNHPILTAAAPHYDRGNKISESILDIEGATCIRRNAYELVKGYDERIFGNEGKELGNRLLDKIPYGKIVYIPEAILYHDLFKGVAHLFSKAQRMAYAESNSHPALKELQNIRNNQKLVLIDGRTKLNKMIGGLVLKVYKLAVFYYQRKL
jgi:GT2 family glycosyltransferase